MNADARPPSTRPQAPLHRPGFGPHPAQTGRRIAGFVSTSVCLVMIVAVAASARSNPAVVSSTSPKEPAAARIALVPSTAGEPTTSAPAGAEATTPPVETPAGAEPTSSLAGRVTTTTRRGSGGSTGSGTVLPDPGSPGTTAPPSGSGPGSTAPPATPAPTEAPTTTEATTTTTEATTTTTTLE